MTKFLVLARGGGAEAFEGMGPEEMQRIIERYVVWSQGLSEAGHLLASDKLRDGEGRIVAGGSSGPVVTDGPYSETKEVVGGFWVIEAQDYDRAVELLAESPHLEFGTLEVRAIEEV